MKREPLPRGGDLRTLRPTKYGWAHDDDGSAMIRPGDEIHYVALLDEDAQLLKMLEMRRPAVVPPDADADSITARVDLEVTIKGGTKGA